MTFFDFVQWCFRDQDSTLATLFVGILVVIGLRYIAEGFRGKASDD